MATSRKGCLRPPGSGAAFLCGWAVWEPEAQVSYGATVACHGGLSPTAVCRVALIRPLAPLRNGDAAHGKRLFPPQSTGYPRNGRKVDPHNLPLAFPTTGSLAIWRPGPQKQSSVVTPSFH